MPDNNMNYLVSQIISNGGIPDLTTHNTPYLLPSLPYHCQTP
jgi:hypothetical protein